jgi:hypothetical protein
MGTVVTAEVEKKFVKEYDGEGPFLKSCVEVEKTVEPKEPVVDFTAPQAYI